MNRAGKRRMKKQENANAAPIAKAVPLTGKKFSDMGIIELKALVYDNVQKATRLRAMNQAIEQEINKREKGGIKQ